MGGKSQVFSPSCRSSCQDSNEFQMGFKSCVFTGVCTGVWMEYKWGWNGACELSFNNRHSWGIHPIEYSSSISPLLDALLANFKAIDLVSDSGGRSVCCQSMSVCLVSGNDCKLLQFTKKLDDVWQAVWCNKLVADVSCVISISFSCNSLVDEAY